jgi:hypothetical protein
VKSRRFRLAPHRGRVSNPELRVRGWVFWGAPTEKESAEQVTTTPGRSGTDLPGLRAAYDEDPSVRIVIDHFAARQYNQNITELDTLRNKLEHAGTPVEKPGLIRALRRLDALGVGRFLLGGRGQATRFEWPEKSLTVRSLATDATTAQPSWKPHRARTTEFFRARRPKTQKRPDRLCSFV